MTRNYWTKSNVKKMDNELLRKWFEQSIENLTEAAKLKIAVPASEKAFNLIKEEMKNRNLL